MSQRAIKKVCVIGSGVMGAGIAAHFANANIPVLFLDLPQEETAQGKNALVLTAIEKMKKSQPAPLMHQSKAALITPGNIADDLEDIKTCDWVIEVIIEQLEAKQALYEKIERYRAPHAIVSSNTSTIPLARLVEGRSIGFQHHFVITHFFNPPRYMRLLEFVKGPQTLPEVVDLLMDFCDRQLGKHVVTCHDTPGFIANRIGMYWLQTAMLEAIEAKITVEEADALFSKPLGMPKTGIFGLMDLVGLDLIPLLGQSMKAALPAADPYVMAYQEPAILKKMIAEGYIGRKGKGGFYRLVDAGDQKVKEAINLQTGEYAPVERSPRLASLEVAREGLKRFLTFGDRGSVYTCSVLLKVLSYAASLVPEIADDICAVDDAMKLGYNWKWGPFELMDKLGPEWVAQKLEAEKKPIPELLQKLGQNSFYKVQEGKWNYFSTTGDYQPRTRRPGVLLLEDIKIASQPLLKNASAALWDIGEGIVCLEFTSKNNSLDMNTLKMIEDSMALIPENYKALVIYNEGRHFSVGANIALALLGANVGEWNLIEELLQTGQRVFKAMKYAPFPVIVAPADMALGGGCEVTLHADAIQAHAETYIGQVEVAVGLVPAWGGCKELLIRWVFDTQRAGGMMVALGKVFEMIGTAQVSRSAEEARDMLILKRSDGITMNRDRLLADAKEKAIGLAQNYQPPQEEELRLPGRAAQTAMMMAVKALVLTGKATPYDQEIAEKLSVILSGGDTDISDPLTEEDILLLERQAFMALIHNLPTLERIDYMLETGKPLRN